MWSLRTRWPILGGLIVASVIGAGCGSRAQNAPQASSPAPAPAPATTSKPAQTDSAPARRSPRDDRIDRFGLVTDALPAPLPMPAGSADDAAQALAQRVMAGGDDALAALLTALQASGALVRNDTRLIVRPAEPWQGLIFDAWEIRTMLATVMPERTVSFALSDLADVVRTPIPALKTAPVAQLLTRDLRRLAQGPASPRRFWARFVIELGRGPGTLPQLVTEPDPAKVRVNGLQASLIVRRLALDLLIASGGGPQKQAVALPRTPAWSFVEPLYADQLPCTLNGPARTIMDVVAVGAALGVGGAKVGDLGFGGIMGVMQDNGWKGAEQTADGLGYASILLAYAKFIATYAALEVKVSMDGEPLVRTKEMKPSSGERKNLTAAVRMNLGNAQMVNCFRIMLNAAGLDFSLPNDGAVKGAQVDWEGLVGFGEADAVLHGGPDQIVRFAGDQGSQYQSGGAFTSFNSITKAVADDEGKVRVTVEGVGQRDKLGQNARKRAKQASVRVNVALQGADFVGDVKDAFSSAAGGLKGMATFPVDMLSRARWASAGHYTFDVTDWSDEGQWTGTVTVTMRRTMTSSSQGPKSHGKSTETQALDAQIHVTDTIQDANSGGQILGNMKATINAHYTDQGESSGGQVGSGCDPGQELTWQGNKWAEGSYGGGEGTVIVVVSGSQVHLGVNSLNFQIPYSGSDNTDEQHAQVESKMTFKGVTRSCSIHTISRTMPIKSTTGIGTIDVEGTVDPKDPDHVHGTVTKTYGGGNDVATQTVTWDLHRG